MRWKYVGSRESGRSSGQHEQVDFTVFPKWVQTMFPSSSERHGKPAASTFSRKSHASCSVLKPSVSTTGMMWTAQTTSASSNSSIGLQQCLLMDAPFLGEVEPRELAMKFYGFAIKCARGVLGTTETADYPITDLSKPNILTSSREMYTLKTGLVPTVRPLVVAAFFSACWTQIITAIIKCNMINMRRRSRDDKTMHEDSLMLSGGTFRSDSVEATSKFLPSCAPLPLHQPCVVRFIHDGPLALSKRNQPAINTVNLEGECMLNGYRYSVGVPYYIGCRLSGYATDNASALSPVGTPAFDYFCRIPAAALAKSIRYILNEGCHKSFLQNGEAGPVLQHLTTPLYQLAEVI